MRSGSQGDLDPPSTTCSDTSLAAKSDPEAPASGDFCDAYVQGDSMCGGIVAGGKDQLDEDRPICKNEIKFTIITSTFDHNGKASTRKRGALYIRRPRAIAKPSPAIRTVPRASEEDDEAGSETSECNLQLPPQMVC